MTVDRSKVQLADLPFDRRTLMLGTTAGLAMVAAGGLTMLSSGPAMAAPQVGKPAPDFTAVDSRGQTQSLSALRGRIVALEWTNHDCPYVRKHYNAGNMQALQRKAADADVVWLSVISSPPGEQGHVSPEQADALTDTRKATPAAVLLDPTGQVGRAYDARVTPHMYLINAEGVLVYMGGIDSIPSARVEDIEKATPYFRDALAAVIKGEPVQNAVTRPYGCSVKYRTSS
ncbi:MAG: redoxin domain-containing protein [Hyphomicrobiaceae bacterium]